MKLIHLSDLHLGKRLHEASLLEDQRDILLKILRVVDDEKPDGVLIAGDVYDKSVPSAEAVLLFDDFLVRLARRGPAVFVISGNHDSPERMAFGSRLFGRSGVHLSRVYDGTVEPVALQDRFGPVNIYLLPFLKPSQVKRFFEDEAIESYTDAVGAAIRHMAVDTGVRNVLVTHQFVTGASRCESEDIAVGGADNVDAAVFEPFDYVALGHLHSPQEAGRETVRYCGTPLKYSFSEAGQQKSIAVVELGGKGNVSVRAVPLAPRHDLREIRGTYAEITLKRFYDGTTLQDDYTHITLIDEEDIPDAIGKLRTIYRNLMKLDYDNRRTRSSEAILGADQIEKKTPLTLFTEFFEKQNNQPMSAEQRAFAAGLIEKIWEADV